MSHLKCKLVLTSFPINPRSNLKDAINDEVLSFYNSADGAYDICHADGMFTQFLHCDSGQADESRPVGCLNH